jgi:hypothetical protein
MKKIVSTIQINLSTAAVPKQGITSISVQIPLIASKLLSGNNILDCIDPKVLPKLEIDDLI